MEKKVIITAYYISVMGQMMEKKKEVDDIALAKEYVEKNMTEIIRTKYEMSPTTIEEEGKAYDVTRLTAFTFSYLDIVDYTDSHDIPQKEQKAKIELLNNKKG